MSEKNFKPVVEGKSGGELIFIKPKELAEKGFTGVVLEGVFEAALQNKFNDAVNDFKFSADDGNTVVINHAGHLAFQMKNVNPGDYCRISYKGMQEYKGRDSHNFLVERADDV